MGTFNWDWETGPPPETYSRVTRDLDAVCAEFVAWLDALPARLDRDFDCQVSEGAGEVVITPANPGAAPLRIERWAKPGDGTTAKFYFGRATFEFIGDCLCDACDTDSPELIETGEQIVSVVTGGFHESRRRHKADPGERLYKGPWLEIGYESEAGASSSASASVKGDLFEVTWLPWERR